MKTILKFHILALVVFALLLPGSVQGAGGRTSRVVKFYGVPPNVALNVKKKFPFIFEREVTLPELDELVRFLMRSGSFSNVEALDRATDNGGRETAIVATVLRRIQAVKVQGNHALSNSEILKLLAIDKSQAFERKHLLAAAEDLRKLYENMGFHNARVEIDFELPNDSEVVINVNVNEGSPVRISDVIIDSPNADLAASFDGMSRSLKGKILTEDELLEFQKSIGNFLVKNRYLTSRLSQPAIAYSPDRTQAKLTYVIENPWKIEFRFEGNEYFVDWTIANQLEEEKLAGTVSSPAPDMAEKIRRKYLEVGFANVEVNYDEKLDEANHVLILHFAIKEGRRVTIQKIEVTGNLSRKEAYYAQFIRSSSSDLIGKGYYNRKDVEDGTKRLVTELQNQGYLRSRIQSQRAEYSPDRGSVVISLVIDEGPLTQIRQIKFEGVESFPKTQLAEILKIKTGAALGLRELEDSISALKSFYRSEGFLEMRIMNETEQNRIVTYNEGNTQATVEFQIYEGPRVRVGTITIEGNVFTKDYVIVRELGFKPGDVLSPEKIDESIFRLQRLDLFSNVELRTLEEGTNIAERTVIIRVNEANPGKVITRIGATNERQHLTLRGSAGISYKNLYGTGRGLSLRFEPKYSTDPRVSYIENILTVSYLEPYIFGGGYRGRINLIREESLFSLDDDRTIIQQSNTIGFLVERDLTRHLRLVYNAYSLSNQVQFDRKTFENTQTLNIAKTGPTFTIDYRDDIFNPTKGIYAYAGFDYSDPIMGSSKDSTQTINFVKTTASITNYAPLNSKKSVVFVTQLRGGYVANISSDPHAGVPAQEAFFLGGRSTIRGFNGTEDELVPNKFDLFPGQTLGGKLPDLRTFVVRADSYFGLVKSELWFPLFGSFGGTVFYDGGAVFINQPDVVQPDPYRDSAGVGIRVITPVGPANIEVGWKLDRRLVRVATAPGGYDYRESPWAFHLSIGAL
jgi:outer membrane protein insertion porin family